MRRDPQGVTLPEDSVRREANHADNKMRHAWKHRRRLRSTARAVVRARGEETPSELEPSGDEEEEEEREVISSPPKILPSPGGLFVWQAGIPASACRVKCPRADADGVSSPPPQFGLTLVCSVLLGMHICICWCTNDLLIQSLVGSLTFVGYRCHCAHDYGVVIIGRWGCGALAQEGPSLVFPAGVFPV
jgi:hypothetical protein